MRDNFRRRVLVIQNTQWIVGGVLEDKHDLSPATLFGEISHLLSPSARPFDAESRSEYRVCPEHVLEELRTKLCDYDARCDHLLLIGNPCLIGFAVTIAASNDPCGDVSLLQWSGTRREYFVVKAHIVG